MIFQKEIVRNSRAAKDQWEAVQLNRKAQQVREQRFANEGLIKVNEGLIPRDVYQEFDNVSVEVMRSDDGDTFLNDLLPLSRSIGIGKLTHQFRKVSDAGNAQTSMSGQVGVLMDQTEFSYDGTIVPIHDAGYFRNWREFAAMSSEGFDALVDDQRETVKTVRRKLADSFLDGHVDRNGNAIVVDGLSWTGMRNDSRVAQVDLGAGGLNFDFSDTAQTPDAVKAAWIQLRDTLWITNNCEQDACYYVSREVASNFERKFSTSYESKTLTQELADLMGVDAIKATNKLTGNQVMAFPLDSSRIKPVVGMAINTVAMSRPEYNSDYKFAVWGAVGFEVRTDFNGLTCAMYASA